MKQNWIFTKAHVNYKGEGSCSLLLVLLVSLSWYRGALGPVSWTGTSGKSPLMKKRMYRCFLFQCIQSLLQHNFVTEDWVLNCSATNTRHVPHHESNKKNRQKWSSSVEQLESFLRHKQDKVLLQKHHRLVSSDMRCFQSVGVWLAVNMAPSCPSLLRRVAEIKPNRLKNKKTKQLDSEAEDVLLSIQEAFAT